MPNRAQMRLAFLYNFIAAVAFRLPRWAVPDVVEHWIVDGCEKYTPMNHPWRDEPMF